MTNDPQQQRRDRYSSSGNPESEYVDDAQLVLRNLEGITDQQTLLRREEELHVIAYERLLAETRLDTRINCELLKYIHNTIFASLFEWAGRYRTVWISKPGITWPAPDFLAENMAKYESDILNRVSVRTLANQQAFCQAIAEIQGEFLVIHPFREGNARTIKLATDLLALQTDRLPLQYDESEVGKLQYIDAARAAFKRDYGPMMTVI